MPAKRKPPPQWWLLGYLTQYQPQRLLSELEKLGVDPGILYKATAQAAQDMPSETYRKMSKAWAVRQHRIRNSSNQ